jgi:hypothetical protein
LFQISPESKPQEKERIVSAEADREIKLVVNAELYDKLQRIRGLLAHSKPEASYAELIDLMATELLAKLEKKKGIAAQSDTIAARAKPLPRGRRVYLPVSITRPIWNRAKGQCEIIANHKRCSSRYRLEIDHIIPLVQNGPNTSENLRLTCWAHNHARANKRQAG